jgi:putative spermidine/putrescine transport system permease protein
MSVAHSEPGPARPGLTPSWDSDARWREQMTAWLLVAPAVLAIIVLFIIPIGYVLLLSVTDPTISLEHYRRIFTVPLYSGVMVNTFKTSLIVTVACLLLGYPLAYVMARRNDWIAIVLLVAVGMSFWTGFVVRTYAWLVILGNKGPVSGLYAFAGWGRPPQLLFTSFSSALGMTHILLPYMVLALYGVMRKIDPSYMRAAEGLGARPFGAFRHVFLPLSLPGLVNGCALVFTMCLGFYITPILLGTPRDMMISQLISQQIEDLLAWGFASAIAVLLLICTLAVLGIYNRYAGLDRLWG